MTVILLLGEGENEQKRVLNPAAENTKLVAFDRTGNDTTKASGETEKDPKFSCCTVCSRKFQYLQERTKRPISYSNRPPPRSEKSKAGCMIFEITAFERATPAQDP